MSWILNCKASENTENDWQLCSALNAGLIPATAPAEAIDRREDWWAVKNQNGSGACVGFAVSDCLYYYFVKAGRLPAEVALSPRWLWMAAKETDQWTDRPTTMIETEGTSIKAALDIARKYGNIFECFLPFSGFFGGQANDFFAAASSYKIAGYINLMNSVDSIRRWLSEKGPVLAAVDIYPSMDSCSGMIDDIYHEQSRGKHAVIICGYGQDRFTIKNSWGTEWGNDGYIDVSIRYLNKILKESYGAYL